MGRARNTLGESRCVWGGGLLGKPVEKRPLGIPRRRWEDNIKMDLQEVEIRGHGLDRAGSGEEQVAGTLKRSN